eukprot:COSAG05_NODE_26201_length_190_cov_27.362637_1_plen_40_part_10
MHALKETKGQWCNLLPVVAIRGNNNVHVPWEQQCTMYMYL